MEIEINKKKYIVNTDEFNYVKSNEFYNLKILKNLSEYERLSNFLNELMYSLDNKNNNLFIVNSNHGGYIPIQCSSAFSYVYLLNTEKIHKENIIKNINNFQILNIVFKSETEITNINYENLHNILFINNYDDKFYNIIDRVSPTILVTDKDSQDFFKNKFKYKYILKNTNYFIYIEKNYNFLEYFKNYIEDNNIINYDNLINFCLMVKNAGNQFEEMLTSNLSIIDRWTILDTGSNDNTIDIINKVLIGKKNGKLYQEKFINFKDSRNRLLELAGTSCTFNLIFDDTYVINGDLKKFLQIVRGDQKADSFSINIESNNVMYSSNRIIKSLSNLKYKYRIHEVISDENNFNVQIPQTCCFIKDRNFDYMTKRTNNRLELDLKLLQEELDDNSLNPRTYYYFGQTYKLMKNYEKALFYYLKRAEFTNSGFRDELVNAIFEASRIANFNLNKPWDFCFDLYTTCYNADNKRPESLYFIGIHYYLEKDYNTSYNYFKKAFKIGFPTHSQYSLKPILSYHFIPKILTRICYNVKDYQLGYESSLFFITNNNESSDDYNEIVSWNKIFEKLLIPKVNKIIKNLFNKPVFVFLADGGYEPWSGSDILFKGVGGSETYIIEIAKHIESKNIFKTIVFCNTPNKKDEIFEGTLYTHIDNYSEFINKTYIHTCIISRYSEYLPLTTNSFVENIYLVLHDVTSSGNVIPIHNKLKNIFCLTEWHCEYFTNIFPNLINITVPFYNGTSFTHDNNINKIPFKFIYSSFPDRGLLQLLEMWPDIYNKEPRSTLHIYCNFDIILGNYKIDIIKNLIQKYTNMNIFNYGWVSKSELEISWQSSDFWFYPCTFNETFCITALESAITKTFVITNGLAGLQNTVNDRGIIIPGNPEDKEWKDKALEQIFFYFNPENKLLKDILINKNYEWATKLSWKARADDLLHNYILKNTLEYKGIFNWSNNLHDTDVMIKIINHLKQNYDNSDMKYHILEVGVHTGISLINLVKNIENSTGIGIDDNFNDQNIINSYYNNIIQSTVQNQIIYYNMNVNQSLIHLNSNKYSFNFIFIAKIDCLQELYLNLNMSWNILAIKGILGINYPSENLFNDEYFKTLSLFINKYNCKIIHNQSMIFLEKL